MSYEAIILSKKDGIAILTLDRPEKMNAMSAALMENLLLALEEVRQDDEVRVLVLTGAGRGFCTGMDMSDIGARAAGESTRPGVRSNGFHSTSYRAALALHGLEKPTIAMVNGAAVGGGCDLALMCDMRIASEQARFGEVFIKLGLVPGFGGMYLLPRLVGLPRACELLFTGDIIDAREAERIGLVNKTVPHDELEAETMDLARKIAMGPPISLRLTKTGIYDCLNRDFASSLDYGSLAISIVQSTEDHREGVRAFAEKRMPVFKGR